MRERLPHITGTFLDFSQRTHRDSELLDWGFDDWHTELNDMKTAGIDTVILHRTMRYGTVYYYSDYFETHLERDWIRPFMDAAENTGMKVFISGLVSDYFFKSDDETFTRLMRRDINLYMTIIKELLGIYRDYHCISGIYISHEVDVGNLNSQKKITAARYFFGELFMKLKEHTNLPILSSPFFTKTTSPEKLADFWNTFLDRPMFDILAIQDGVGCDRDITEEDVKQYFEALNHVFLSKGITFWHNAESFSFNPGFRRSEYDKRQIWLFPAPLNRLDAQVKAGFPYTEKTITWEYGHFLGRLQVGEDWYQAFKRWNLGENL